MTIVLIMRTPLRIRKFCRGVISNFQAKSLVYSQTGRIKSRFNQHPRDRPESFIVTLRDYSQTDSHLIARKGSIVASPLALLALKMFTKYKLGARPAALIFERHLELSRSFPCCYDMPDILIGVLTGIDKDAERA